MRTPACGGKLKISRLSRSIKVDTTIVHGLQKNGESNFCVVQTVAIDLLIYFLMVQNLIFTTKKFTGRFIEFEPLCASAKDHNRSQILEITILKPGWKMGFGC